MSGSKKFQKLADLYAAILKGEIAVDESFVVVDGGDFAVYKKGEKILEVSEEEAMIFVSDILGLSWERP